MRYMRHRPERRVRERKTMEDKGQKRKGGRETND